MSKTPKLSVSMMFDSELLPFRGTKRKKGPQKRVRTRFLNNPMSSQLFFCNNSSSNSLRSAKCPPTKLQTLDLVAIRMNAPVRSQTKNIWCNQHLERAKRCCNNKPRFWRLSNSLREKQSSETCSTQKTDSRDILLVVSEPADLIFRGKTNRWL